MAQWISDWVQGVYSYVTGGRSGQRNRKTSSKTLSSSSASSAGALRRKIAQKQHKKPAVLGAKEAGVKKRDSRVKTPPSKRGGKKGGAERASNAKSDAEGSSQRITAAERAAVNAEVVLEPVEHLDRADPKSDDWTDAELELFNHLQDRGLVPILPSSFKLDFETLNHEIFTSDDAATLINSRKGPDLHAIRALQSLGRVGERMRPLLQQRRHASAVLLRTINAYVKCTMDDAGLRKRELIPILCVKANRADEKHKGAIGRMRIGLNKLAVRHRERYQATIAASNSKGKRIHKSQGSLNKSGSGKSAAAPSVPDAIVPPVLFGIILVRGVMTFVALDASDARAELKFVGLFDWAHSGQDLWNALAIAILVMMVRNYQESLGAEMRMSDDEDDPDA